jgi:hypothetical protein
LASATAACVCRRLAAPLHHHGERARAAAEQHERQHRDAGQQRHDDHHGARHAERARIAGQLAQQRLVGRLADAGLGDQQAGGGRDDQRRHLRHQAVADGEQRVARGRLGEADVLLGDADDHAADDVDEHHQQAGDRVAAHELRGAVHRAEERALVLELLAPAPRVVLVDQAGREVGVDRHLLARHRVQIEARRHLGDAAGALGDHHEVHDHQDREHDDADHEVAAHHEVAERLDDVAGGRRALVPVRQDQPGRRQVEREPQHGGDQQHGGERGELERRMDEQRRHQDQHREDDRDGKREIEQQRRQRQQQHHQDGEYADRQREVAAAQEGDEFGEARQPHAAGGFGRDGAGGLPRRDIGHANSPARRKPHSVGQFLPGVWLAPG